MLVPASKEMNTSEQDPLGFGDKTFLEVCGDVIEHSRLTLPDDHLSWKDIVISEASFDMEDSVVTGLTWDDCDQRMETSDTGSFAGVFPPPLDDTASIDSTVTTSNSTTSSSSSGTATGNEHPAVLLAKGKLGVVKKRRERSRRPRHVVRHPIAQVADSVKEKTTKKLPVLLPVHAVRTLEEWLATHFSNPYPSESEKLVLKAKSGLTWRQLQNWFSNTRYRMRRNGYLD